MKKLSLFTALLLPIILAVFIFSNCNRKPDFKIKDSAVLDVAVGPNPDTIDPAISSTVDSATLIIHAFEGLYTLDKDGVPVPGQAEKVSISEDGLTYTFTLRPSLKWSDGTPITAQDYVYSWNRAIAPQTGADYEYLFESIAGYDDRNLKIVAKNDRVFEVKLTKKTPYFLELTTFPAFSPVKKEIIEKHAEQWALVPEFYISNGPYTLVEWMPSSYMLFEKNRYYWNVNKLGPDQIKFHLIADADGVLAAFKDGTILFSDDIPSNDVNNWRNEKEFHAEGQLGTYFISFNTQKAPFDNPLVRKAFSLAIDRDHIVNKIGKAGQQPAGAFIPTGFSDAVPGKAFREVGGNYVNPTKIAFRENLAQAQKLMKDAGYENGKGFPRVEYLYNTEGKGHKLIAMALRNMWKELGVDVTLKPLEWTNLVEAREQGTYQIARNVKLGDYNDPVSFLEIWTTGSEANDSGWSNETYDQLIADVNNINDKKERYAIMHDAEDLLFKDSVLAPLYYYVDLYLINSRLQDVYSSPLGLKYFMYATITE